MERALKTYIQFVAAVVIVVIALLMLSYVLGVCAGAAQLGYEWATS